MAVLAVRALAADYPEARRSDHVDDYFGTRVSDPYRWMEAIDSPETAAWVAAERAYTAAELSRLPERAPIGARLRALWNFPKYGIPEKRGDRLFYRKNDGLQNQSVLYVQDGAQGDPRVLLDPNGLSADGTIALTVYSPTHDGALLGYGLAAGGSDWNEFHVRNVATGRDLPDIVRWVKFSGIAWTRDAKGFFYSRYAQAPKGSALFGRLEGRRLYYHRLGTPQAADRLVLEFADHPDWFFNGDVTDDGRYLAVTISLPSSPVNALYYADLGAPDAPNIGAPMIPLLDRFDAEYSFVGDSNGRFLVLTTKGAPMGRVVSIDPTDHDPAHWSTPVPQSADRIEDEELAGGRLVSVLLHDAKSRIEVRDLGGRNLGAITLPGIGAVSEVSASEDDPEIFYGFSSFLIPPSVFSHSLDTGVTSVFRSPKAPFDPSGYETRQVFYRSKDGTRVPMFITAKKGLSGPRPTWLYGYGGFDISLPPAFSVATAVWLEMGGVYAQPNIRGGGEYGEAWHLAGTKERKQNVFDDFIAAADYLVRKGITSRDRLVIEGRSNGGLLIAAVLNQRPDLCAVALPTVGVLDMLRYQTYTIGADWASDYGTSDTPGGFRYLRAYSPVHNVKAGVKYPPVLIGTGDHDDRVFPAHSFKYAAEMQWQASRVPGSGPILIRIEHNAGHGGSTGSSPVSKTIDEWTDEMGFAAHFMPEGSLQLPAPGP
ncbi:MAG TPA: prolyl oligopeptidase family serine peptidase [Opitutaceae bacterium]